jgi:hypothetical protein
MSLDIAEKRRNFMVSLRKDAINDLLENRRRIFMGNVKGDNSKKDSVDSRTKKQVIEKLLRS